MVKAIEDTFEKLVEQGATQVKKAAKSAVQQVSSSVSASRMWEELLGVKSESKGPESVEEKRGEGKSHTPLNFDKLAKSYQKNEQQKAETLKYRLFQLVKRGEEKVIEDKKKEIQEKQRKATAELQTKKQRAEEAKQSQEGDIPQGKVRKSIFSHKKVAQRQHAELKPSSGKQ